MRIHVGNILSVDQGIIAHGCNSRGVMNSGVARQLREKYPQIYEPYGRDTRGLGTMTLVKVSPYLFVANLITQKDYGRDPSRVYVNYEALDMAMETLRAAAGHTQVVHFPMIGGGLGNGDKQRILKIMEHHFPGDEGNLWLLTENDV